MNMTKSQRDKVREVPRRRYYDVVIGRMDPDDGTMTREVVTASTGRVRDTAKFSRRGKALTDGTA